MIISFGGGLGRVRLTFRSSELCCRDASWREREGLGGVAGEYGEKKMYGKRGIREIKQKNRECREKSM